jgi:hypothetical protein
VTPLDQGKISDDIIVRLALRRLHPINSWEIVRSLFKAKHLDPRITRYAFLADLLLEHASTRDIPPVAGGLVDADTVWGMLLTERLLLSSSHPDAVEILQRSAETDLPARWKSGSAEFRTAALAWMGETGGEISKAILGCLEGEHGQKALAIGLVMGVVYHDMVGHDLDKAAGRLEAYIGTSSLPVELLKRWRDAAAVAAEQLSKPNLRRCLEEAETVLQGIGASDHAWRSDILESGFEQRLSRLGKALAAHVDSRATEVTQELHSLSASVLQHRLARERGRRIDRVDMAIRLSRWLANKNRNASPNATGLLATAQAYACDSGFVDWARQVLRGGEPNKDLAAAFVRLVERITELREMENLQFGQAIKDEQAGGDAAAGLIPVEKILDHVVVKAAEHAPVLLLLIDGMSWAVFRELVSDIESNDWIDLGFSPTPKRLIGLAAIPSVTEICRTSLLCGTLKRGKVQDEVQGFTTHAGITGVSQAGFAPKIFHKAALEGEDDTSLASDIRHALADKRQRVVGIIINAVDDHLDKGDQIDAVWTTERIRVLKPILAESRAAGRIVILLSDHGHILDRQTECREAQEALRWRRSSPPIAREEVEITSPRVLMPDGGVVVIPWSERLRYGPKKNGYHGGATPQEMLIPIAVLWPELQIPDGFCELPLELPSWWTEPTMTQAAPPSPKSARQPRKDVPPTLFELPATPQATPQTNEDLWIAAMIRSDMYVAQKARLTGRVPIDDAAVSRFLSALASRGGSMTTAALASAIGMPEHRLPGLLAVLQRLINVEGYSILDRQEAANTLVLNVPLLKKQFELGA